MSVVQQKHDPQMGGVAKGLIWDLSTPLFPKQASPARSLWSGITWKVSAEWKLVAKKSKLCTSSRLAFLPSDTCAVKQIII